MTQGAGFSARLGERMRAITDVRAFVHAHLCAQRKLVALFGNNGCITTVEEARAIMESQTQVYKVLHVASVEAADVDSSNVVCVRLLRDNIKLTRELVDFVMSACASGVITGREAETI